MSDFNKNPFAKKYKAKLKALKHAKGEYEMPKEEAIAEHKRLTRRLASRKGLGNELKIQRSELKKMSK